MRWLAADCFMAISVKLLAQNQPKIKEEIHFMVIVLSVVATSGKTETLPPFWRNFLLLNSR
jgi:hypothetical protein